MRSLYISKPIKNGEILTVRHLKSVRPGYGLAPKYLEEVVGKKVKCNLEMGDRLTWDVL